MDNYEDGFLEAQYEDRFISDEDDSFVGFDDDEDGDDYPEPSDDLDDGPYHFIAPGSERW